MTAPGLRLHKRTMHVQSAEGEFLEMALRFEEERDLTTVEMAQILTSSLQSALKYMLRAERHPGDPDRKADEE